MSHPLSHIFIKIIPLLIGGMIFCNDTDTSWHMFRGNSQLTGHMPAAHMPNPAAIKLKWSYKTGAAVKSSPVIHGDRLYVGGMDSHVYALDNSNGKLIWKTKLGRAVEATPLVCKGIVYIGSSDRTFYALDAGSGKIKWQFKTEGKILGGANVFNGADGKSAVVFGSYDNFVYCLDAESGELKWKYESENYINGTPSHSANTLSVGGCDASLYVIGIDGKLIRSIDLEHYIASSVAIKDGIAYLGNYGDTFSAVVLETGVAKWTYKTDEKPFLSSAAVTDSLVIVGAQDSKLHALNIKTGEKQLTFQAKNFIDSSPVISGKYVTVGSHDGRLYVLKTSDGTKAWSYEIGKEIESSPAVFQKVIYVGCNDGRVYAFGEKE
jgi:outer membrane protein assembly factor BamB